MSSETLPLKTIQRAAEIMELLSKKECSGVADLSERMDMPKSTVHDYLKTLQTLGFVVNEDGTYRLGFRLLELGGEVKYRNRLYHVARPELERLAETTGEAVSVNVEECGRFVILHTEQGDESLQLGIYPGLAIPLHTHAAGKVMLAGFSQEKVDRIVDEHGLTQQTADTITDYDELMTELEQAREQGYAVDSNEQIVGMGVVAAPVEVENHIIGSIGIVCPTDRLEDDEFRRELVREVQKSANIVSVNYQYS